VLYEARADRNVKLREELNNLAEKYPALGFPMLFCMLKNSGWKVNKKRVERLYREEKLMLRRRKKRLKYVVNRELKQKAKVFGDCWSMDFVHDSTVDGKRLRFLNIIDDASRQCVTLYCASSIPADEVTAQIEQAIIEYGKPKKIRVDNGPEFRSNNFLRWAFANKIQVVFIQPGKPTQNALIESFNGRFRVECLNQQWFFSIDDAKEKVRGWREFYNRQRPHSALGGIPPMCDKGIEQQKQLVNC
jgi:putative transposase